MRISLFCFGNQDRGDDGAGAAFYTWAQQELHTHTPSLNGQPITLIEDFQLEPEHIYDLLNCDTAVFVDCILNGDAPVGWRKITTGNQLMFSSHCMPPESLLYLFEATFNRPAPPCYLLSIAGHCFDLGSPISTSTHVALQQAKRLFLQNISNLTCHSSTS